MPPNASLCTGRYELINGSLVTDIGAAHNKSGAQVAIRWLVQSGVPAIPRSTNAQHIVRACVRACERACVRSLLWCFESQRPMCVLPARDGPTEVWPTLAASTDCRLLRGPRQSLH
jgi:hypothetical protein